MQSYYMDPIAFIAEKNGVGNQVIKNILELLEGGATIPFIARYRKERTGNMDEVGVEAIKKSYEQFLELEKRKKAVLESISAQEKLTSEL